MSVFRGVTRMTGSVIAATLAIGVANVSAAQTKETPKKTAVMPDRTSETFGFWTLTCRAKLKQCDVSQALRRRKDRARVLNVSIIRSGGKDGGLILRTLAPLGLRLADGVTLTVDKDKPKKLAFMTCVPGGCLAQTRLDAGFEKALRAGKILGIGLVGVKRGKKIELKMRLNGLGGALDRLNSI